MTILSALKRLIAKMGCTPPKKGDVSVMLDCLCEHTNKGENQATGECSHAEGYHTEASSTRSHAEGDYSKAGGFAAHAQNECTHAWGYFSHTEGVHTVAWGKSQHAQGEWNIPDETNNGDTKKRGKFAHIVGNGTAEDARSNAHTLDWEGNAWYAGSVEGKSVIVNVPVFDIVYVL